MILVEEKPHRHAALQRAVEGPEQSVCWSVLQPQVVDGDVQRGGGAVEKGGDPLGDGVGGLTAVGEEEQVKGRCRGYRESAFGSPVWRGSSTLTGSGLVAISAASSGSSVKLSSLRSSAAIAPAFNTTSSSQSMRPCQ